MINVTKTFLPSFDEYAAILKRSWDKAWITNNGELVQELEQSLKEYLGVKHLFFTSNGTVVLQMALKAYGITREVITTPFSYVATTNAILWEGCTPVFADINPTDCCIDADKIESLVTENSQAILATHVYGLPCNVEKIEKIAQRHHLKVIYDAAHAFGCTYNGKSLLAYGDISTCSFHATKVFHTVEGGCIITHDDEIAHRLLLYRQFGHIGDDYFSIGLNGKNSEFHAAMGVAILPKVHSLIDARKELIENYQRLLKDSGIKSPVDTLDPGLHWNFSYYPVLFHSEEELIRVSKALTASGFNGRRYFYPSLNQLPYIGPANSCPVSEKISKSVFALPLYPGLPVDTQEKIIAIVRKTIA